MKIFPDNMLSKKSNVFYLTSSNALGPLHLAYLYSDYFSDQVIKEREKYQMINYVVNRTRLITTLSLWKDSPL